MSERMTDDETRRFIEAVNYMNALGGNEVHVPREVMTKVAQEISAGRSSEVRKDATIKALADALWGSGLMWQQEWHTPECVEARQTLGHTGCPDSCAVKRNALRRAGRLS